jgi:hypothetical protein
MTNHEHHGELQQNVTKTWNQLLHIDKELSGAKWLSDMQDVPKYNTAYAEWQQAQVNYIHFMTNTKGLKPLDTFVSHDIKDFGVWIPKDINDTKGFDMCSVLHDSQPHTSLDKVFKGTKAECEKYAKENVKVF